MVLVRARILILSAIILASVATGTAGAQGLPGWLTKQFSIERIDADRVRLIREVEIEGEANTPQAGQKFFADDLQMNIKTGELIAEGNVVFQTPTARISADSVVFNTKTSRGTFTNASGIAQLGERGERNRSMFGTLEPDVYFRGATIEKIDDDKYRITKGSFTTCVQPTPRWEIVSGSATLNLDDYVMMRNAVVRVKDVPVFYLPVMYYPIQEDDRATGFLLPMYGSSQATGSSISSAFFWAINRSQDATLWHDWMFSRGQGVGAEYRYLFGPQAQGNFTYYWLDEKEAVINGRTRNARQSTAMRGSLTQNLPLGLTARARVDYITDVAVRQTYDRNFYNASNSNRTYNGGISGSWRNLSLNGTFQRVETFADLDRSTVTGQEPGFSAALSGVKLGPLPVFATVNAEAARNVWISRNGTTELDQSLVKADLTPSVRAALSTLPFLQINATASYRTTYYSESLGDDLRTQIEVPVTRSYGDMRLDLIGPVLSRVFNPNNAIADRMKHVIEPSFSVSRRSEIPNQDRIPNATGWDIIVGGVTQMTYALTNKLMVRKEKEGSPQSSAPRELLNLSVRQSYYTDEKASKYDTSYSFGYGSRVPSAFSPVAMTVRATPIDPVALDYRLEYDPNAEGTAKSPKLLGMGLTGSLRTRDANVSANWNRSAFTQTLADGRVITANNIIGVNSDFRILQSRYGGQVEYNFDIARRTLLNQRYVAFYNAQCCGVSFEFQSINYPNSSRFLVPKDRRFNMSFTLAGVGSFSNFFGAFGGGGTTR
ncbi:MAG: Organic solvent tolerance protein [Acidobacteriota bacterium]